MPATAAKLLDLSRERGGSRSTARSAGHADRLVVNELLTNALKHASVGRDGGTIPLHLGRLRKPPLSAKRRRRRI